MKNEEKPPSRGGPSSHMIHSSTPMLPSIRDMKNSASLKNLTKRRKKPRRDLGVLAQLSQASLISIKSEPPLSSRSNRASTRDSTRSSVTSIPPEQTDNSAEVQGGSLTTITNWSERHMEFKAKVESAKETAWLENNFKVTSYHMPRDPKRGGDTGAGSLSPHPPQSFPLPSFREMIPTPTLTDSQQLGLEFHKEQMELALTDQLRVGEAGKDPEPDKNSKKTQDGFNKGKGVNNKKNGNMGTRARGGGGGGGGGGGREKGSGPGVQGGLSTLDRVTVQPLPPSRIHKYSGFAPFSNSFETTANHQSSLGWGDYRAPVNKHFRRPHPKTQIGQSFQEYLGVVCPAPPVEERSVSPQRLKLSAAERNGVHFTRKGGVPMGVKAMFRS